MGTITAIFHAILYQPLFNALVLLYQYFPGHDFGIAVIILTVLIRILLYPLMFQSIKSQKILAELQPKIQEIQNKYKNDKEKQTKATMELYQKEKINPFGGCLPLLIQLPILIALFQVFSKGLLPESKFHMKYVENGELPKGQNIYHHHAGDGDCINLGGDCVSDWTVDELMEMYSWKYEVSLEKSYGEFPKITEVGWESTFGCFSGDTFRDCWLQLVMWDKHGMTWNDEQGKWLKDGELP